MKDTKTLNPAERQTYVPAEVKVTDITLRGVICTSGGTENYNNTNNPDWF